MSSLSKCTELIRDEASGKLIIRYELAFSHADLLQSCKVNSSTWTGARVDGTI